MSYQPPTYSDFEIDLYKVGTTSFTIDSDPSSPNYEIQLQAKVQSYSESSETVTIQWYVGTYPVARRTTTVNSLADKTVAKTIDWANVEYLAGQSGSLKAVLLAGSYWPEQETSYGTISVLSEPSEPNPDPDPDPTPGDCPDGYYFDTAFGICLPAEDDTYTPPDDGTNDPPADDGTNDPTQTPDETYSPSLDLGFTIGSLSPEASTVVVVGGMLLLLILI